MTRTRSAALALVLVGVIQMAGDLAGILPLKAIGAALGASPAPKVFSAVRGLETYSTRFYLEWPGRRVELTPALYARLRGPYNRRNVYGAVLAYAPVLSSDPRARDAFQQIAAYALCGEAPLLRELGIEAPAGAGPPIVTLEPLPGTSVGDLETRFAVDCGPGR